jgi:hypothetical protein
VFSVPFFTYTGPVVAVPGTVATIVVFVQEVIDPFLLLKNFTWSPDTRVPKPVPVSVMTVPVGPQVFDSDDRYGPVVTVSVTPLLACPLVTTSVAPVAAPAGTSTWISVSDQD